VKPEEYYCCITTREGGTSMSEALNYNQNVMGMPFTDAYSHVMLFLNQKRKHSKNTADAYTMYVKEFFMFQFGKVIQNVTWEDLQKISKSKVLSYREYLESKGNNNNTINQKTASLKKMWLFLLDEKRGLNDTCFNVELLPVNKNNPNGYGSFTGDEMIDLIEYAKTHKIKGTIKSLFIETSYVTAIRKDCLLNMKWSSFVHQKDKSTGLEMYVFKFHDKGKDEITAISDVLAEKILSLRTEEMNRNDKIFNVNQDTIADMIRDFCKERKLSNDRNLAIHSIKKASGDRIHAMLNDITVTAKHLHHTNIQTPYNNYLGKNHNLASQPSYFAFDKECTIDDLKILSHEDLLSVIENTGSGVIMQLCMKKKQMNI
jgi:site-specific recombinase XerC